jgi:hypothetical protein
MGRAALQTIRGMSDVEIDRLVQDLSNKDLILNGPLYKKAIDAGMKVASVKPGVMIGIILNLARG